ncbi:serine protease [Pelagibius litoralis]|uniref:Serine protease n=1 Tax=Pelagibius litoralis TaxID=374515 RepID=A0A967EWW1_9PROT|nr:S1C family serine protease [Pelagibius litoralis]NIA68658.1 serine protease [Pelagibius litoralis]
MTKHIRLFPAVRCLQAFTFGLLCLLTLIGLPLAPATAQTNPLGAVVGVRAEVPPSARTAGTLGTEREGGGVVIGADGLVLTIGYLILEAVQAEVVLQDGETVPADIVAYDYDTGFGLLRPATTLNVAPIELGDSDALSEQTQVLVAGPDGPSAAMVVSRREFAGYWEYLLPNAIFTAPPYRAFGGAALIGADGRLLGIGSLIVGDALAPGETFPGNMFVPISMLRPIMDDLMRQGRAGGPARPWLGLFTQELRGHVFINRVSPDGPAATAGVMEGDIVVAVGGEPVSNLSEFYRKIWALGDAGIDVPLTILKGADGFREVSVKSGDRYDYLKLDPTY